MNAAITPAIGAGHRLAPATARVLDRDQAEPQHTAPRAPLLTPVARTSATKRSRTSNGPRRMSDADFFGAQPTSSHDLPDPTILLQNLSRCVIEVLAGVRELEQLSRWLHQNVFQHLLRRVVLAARAREARKEAAVQPVFSIGRILRCEPRDGVVEATVMVHGRARTRALAIRLEGLDGRWRATALHVL